MGMRVAMKSTQHIVQKYGVDTFAIIEDNIELLIEVEGIGHKRVQMIAESWERQKEIKNIMLFLQEHQVSTSYAVRNVTVTKRNTLLKERLYMV